MIGAIIGDIVGSRFEFHNTDRKDFEFFTKQCDFTDDTVMSLAVAEAIMQCWKNKKSFDDLDVYAVRWFHKVGMRYPFCGYGGRFFQWMHGDDWSPYGSYGNGAAMRISAVGDIAKTVEEAEQLSFALTAVTHNHPEGLLGAEAAAVAKVMLKNGKRKSTVRKFIEENYYNLDKTVDQWREANKGEHGAEICQVTMPQAFVCFFEGDSFEDVIRNCISIGGDSDTIAAIAGGIAEACYPVPEWMRQQAREYLTSDLVDILDRWERFAKEVKKDESYACLHK